MSCGLCPPQRDPPEKENVPKGESPIVLRRCSLTSSMSEEEDDGFMEILDEEEMKVRRRRMDPTHGVGEWEAVGRAHPSSLSPPPLPLLPSRAMPTCPRACRTC